MPNAAAISSSQHAQLQQQVGMTVMRKTLDQARTQGDAAVALLESAAELQKSAPAAKAQPLAPHQTIDLVA